MNEQEFNEQHNEQAQETVALKKKKPSFLSECFDYFELFIISACVVLMLFSFVTRLCKVDGPSMLNTLHHGEMLVVSDLFYDPQRGDIIVFHQTGEDPDDLNKPIVKRIIATGGEWISVEKNDNDTLTVTIYDEACQNPIVLNETYANYEKGPGHYRYDGEPVQVPDGCLFVMGDNRGNSQDSRTSSIGFVDERRVLGKVVFRVTPFDKFGVID